jgi:hypothetical protein
VEELGLTPLRIKRLTKPQWEDEAVWKVHQEAVLGRRRQIVQLAQQYVPRYSLYTCRHSWCTDALEPTFRTSRLDYLGISGGPSRSVIVGRRHRQQAQDLLL